ncbi:uncharacterized protein LOC126923675 [Bombus affinis]|uniref:uncharacterized protein LOC126923675 n=1 Tax=Bombus affinis TaxID=309941 RepID=UPI0021B6F91A|nr:uncharacterized protein LOC126923675 [Bombus affinis]
MWFPSQQCRLLFYLYSSTRPQYLIISTKSTPPIQACNPRKLKVQVHYIDSLPTEEIAETKDGQNEQGSRYSGQKSRDTEPSSGKRLYRIDRNTLADNEERVVTRDVQISSTIEIKIEYVIIEDMRIFFTITQPQLDGKERAITTDAETCSMMKNVS